ncbi:MAG: flavodoxin, partial [Clostridiales Family XIII bacterium]|nr:flavodoxin [Clostridiales Family XIII bacterium]
MKNIVFCFSGTGNSLKAAKSITRELGGGSPISMARTDAYVLTDRHDAIGFVFPLYFAGLPGIVRKFVVHLNVENNKNAYYYAIVTYGGGFADNGLSQLNELLLKT